MKKTAVLLTALLCAGLVFSGTAGAAISENAPMKILENPVQADFGEPSFLLALHPLSLLLTDAEADKLQALSDMIWLPENDGALAGLYYPKVIPVMVLPDMPLDYSSYWEPSTA